MNVADWLGTNTVYVVLSGSQAYGTATEDSDHDYRGAAHLLTSDKWEFAHTEEEYLKDKKILDKHFHVKN